MVIPHPQAMARAGKEDILLGENFKFQKTEPEGGDPAIWKSLVTRVQRD